MKLNNIFKITENYAQIEIKFDCIKESYFHVPQKLIVQ